MFSICQQALLNVWVSEPVWSLTRRMPTWEALVPFFDHTRDAVAQDSSCDVVVLLKWSQSESLIFSA